MIRKILLVAAAIAMPVGMVAATGSTAFAGSKPPPDPAITCSMHGGSISFASPGLTTGGTLTASKSESTTTTGITLETSGTDPACSGSVAGQTITSKTGSCKSMAAEYPVCSGATKTLKYAYDSQASFEASSTTATIAKSLKALDFTANSISYTTKTKSAVSEAPGTGDACADSEAGFLITGEVESPSIDKGQTSSALICLGNVTAGTGTTGQPFISAFLGLTGSQTIETVAIDPATSTVHVTGS
jgi:hypothetical protein